MKRWPVVLALAMMGGAWILLVSLSRAEGTPARQAFAGFPLEELGSWTGHDLALDERVLDLLKLTDYVMRVYLPTGGGGDSGPNPQDSAPVWFYVGYYGSQRTGATYHSPKNCLPGAGWQFSRSDTVEGVIPGKPDLRINRVVIEKGLERQLVLYWYQDRGRVVASEYAAKAYLIWDAMTRNRTDGALVRISTPVLGSEDDAFRHALGFLGASWEPLLGRLPE